MNSETQWAGHAGAPIGFSINYEEVPQTIVNLEHAARFFRQRAKDFTQTGTWASEVSDNNPAVTLDAGAKQLEDLAHKLRDDLKSSALVRHGVARDVSEPIAGVADCSADVYTTRTR